MVVCKGYGGERCIQGLVGTLGGKRPLSRPRRIWDDINEIDIMEVGCGRMDCIGLGQYR